MNSVFNRLCGLVNEERGDLLNNVVVLEGRNVERTNKAAEDWLGARERFNSLGQDVFSELIDKPNQLSLQHDPNISVAIDFMDKHSKLEKQIGLTSELHLTRNISTIKKETKVLKQLFKETCEMSAAVQDQLPSKERNKILALMKSTEQRVKEATENTERFRFPDERDIEQLSNVGSIRSEVVGTRHCNNIFRRREERDCISEPGKRAKCKSRNKMGHENKYKEVGSLSRATGDKDKITTNGNVSSTTQMISSNFEADLLVQLEDIFDKMRARINFIEEMISMKDTEGLQGNIKFLNDMQRKREKTVLILFRLLPEHDATQVAEKIAVDDSKIAELKVLARNLILEEAEVDEGRGSHCTSLTRSTRENLSEIAIKLNTDFSKKKQREEGSDYKGENLKERYTSFQKEFLEQKERCLELVRSDMAITSGEEIEKLEKINDAMTNTAVKLREHLPSIEADRISLEIADGDNDVFEAKKKLINKMTMVKDNGKEDFGFSHYNVKGRNESGNKVRLNNEMSRMKVKL